MKKKSYEQYEGNLVESPPESWLTRYIRLVIGTISPILRGEAKRWWWEELVLVFTLVKSSEEK